MSSSRSRSLATSPFTSERGILFIAFSLKASRPVYAPVLVRSRNDVAACMMASSLASARGIVAASRPSQSTMIRSATASSSGSSLEVMTMARPSDASRLINW